MQEPWSSRARNTLLVPGERMVKRKPLESSWQAILDLTLVPVVARLPAAVRAERRDAEGRHALLCRVHSEFEEMPGLSLTTGRPARSFRLSPDIASPIVERLTAAQVLRLSS